MEFALVLPMLLVLLLGIADFGRVFSAGITMEAAARNAAEAAAQEYVQLVRNNAGTLDAADYGRIHTVAMEAVCREAEILPNHDDAGGSCSMPLAAVCVHDDNDQAGCGNEADPTVTACDDLNGTWDDANNGPTPSGAPPMPYVEVRVCYRFTTLFNLTDVELPFGWGLSLGEIYLERERHFTVACFQQTAGPCL